ncbi:MAG: FixH family protein [Pseudomonadota bacterium]
MSMTGAMDGEFRITGRHVLGALIAFFAVIFIANGIFLTLALRSFPGEHVEKSYLQGLNYNETLARREAQAALGWRVSIEEATLAEDEAVISLRFQDAENVALIGLDLAATLSRPANDQNDQSLEFEPQGGGLYRAIASDVAPGAWVLSVAAYRPYQEEAPAFEFDAKVALQ